MKRSGPGRVRIGHVRVSLGETFGGIEYPMGMIEISCEEVWREVSNYVDGDVDPGLRASLEAHIKVCAHCKAIVDGTQNVVKLLADGVEYPLPEGFGKRLYSKIKNA